MTPSSARFLLPLPHAARAALAAWLLVAAPAALGPRSAAAQIDGGAAAPPAPTAIVHVTAAPVTVHAGGTAVAAIDLAITAPWHINANPPSPSYMIATSVDVHRTTGLMPGLPKYPPGKSLKVEFDPKPLAVYDQTVTIHVPIRAAANAAAGKVVLAAKLRFQSCNDQVCLAPTTIPFQIPVTVAAAVKAAPKPSAAKPAGGKRAEAGGDSSAAGALASGAAAGGATPDSGVAAARSNSASPGGGGGAAAPVGAALGSVAGSAAPGGASPAAVSNNPLANAINRGGLVAFLSLFAVGLALNLTPCVYPMIGVTLSIFGARKATPPMKVLGSAALYVLGMCVMYSALGVIAALTGGMFGAFLQNKFVLVGIGVLLLAMSLSMFGLYELQPPAWLLAKIGGGGGSNAIGTFLSGLAVGIFAAPCVGPPVVALLAIVGAKGDVWFGFRAFFVLALGLGAPYLFLATSSNLLQRLPRSGDWMEWVKKLFGVILVMIGSYYLTIAVRPDRVVWVIAAIAIVGGAYLGFVNTIGNARPSFTWTKRLVGLAGIAAGVWLIGSTPTTSAAIVFRPYDPAAVQSALAQGKPVILDFSADWCIPCHELERSTFTDPKVIAAAGAFQAFKVDLTQQDSPEVAARAKAFRIQGVPTVIFLRPGAGEVDAARFSGFIPPREFLARMKLVTEPARQG